MLPLLYILGGALLVALRGQSLGVPLGGSVVGMAPSDPHLAATQAGGTMGAFARTSRRTSKKALNKCGGGRWTKEEDQKLRAAVAAVGQQNWKVGRLCMHLRFSCVVKFCSGAVLMILSATRNTGMGVSVSLVCVCVCEGDCLGLLERPTVGDAMPAPMAKGAAAWLGEGTVDQGRRSDHYRLH